MRIIKTSTLRKFWQAHREAEASLRMWVGQTRAAQWRNFPEVRKTFTKADLVTVASGRPVVVFNIAHNRYRLIAALHFNTRIVYTLMILTHKEYDAMPGRNSYENQDQNIDARQDSEDLHGIGGIVHASSAAR